MKAAEGSTVLGKSVSIKGDVVGTEDLFLDGEIDGSIRLPEGRLTIGPNGRARADVEVRDLIVFGQLSGQIIASGRVDLRQSATVLGDIRAGTLAIEESASLKGRVELTAAQAAGATATGSASSASSPQSARV